MQGGGLFLRLELSSACRKLLRAFRNDFHVFRNRFPLVGIVFASTESFAGLGKCFRESGRCGCVTKVGECSGEGQATVLSAPCTLYNINYLGF